MATLRHVAVIDIGKTNSKVALVDVALSTELVVRKQANQVLRGPPYPHYDVDAIWHFILHSLTELNRETSIDAISVTTHGVTAVLIDPTGQLVLPVLDYEFDGYGEWANLYRKLRPDFSETGSPHLPMGLNLGAQLFWLEKSFPIEFAKATQILMYPQYWTYRLTHIASNEVTSLGCHTDLWCPFKNDYSSLVDQMDWRSRFAPIRPATDVLGTVSAELAMQTGLKPSTPVAVGIHDSNASLLPHVLARSKPFSVVSSGTWVISMAMGGDDIFLDEKRDCLINVNAFGNPVPSSRFMGGREFEILSQGTDENYTDDDVEAVLKGSVYLLPSVIAGSGPYPHQKARWIGDAQGGQRLVAVSFYLALMTATCLSLIGAKGDIILEGPFLKNALFVEMLATATGQAVFGGQSGNTGTTIGAALLFSEQGARQNYDVRHLAKKKSTWHPYVKQWREFCEN